MSGRDNRLSALADSPPASKQGESATSPICVNLYKLPTVTITALLILPANPQWIPAKTDDLVEVLHEIGLVGPSLGDGPVHRFRSGERFLDHVTFLGCSPQVELEPTADGSPYCQVRLAVYSDGPRLIRGRNRRPPRCPYCRSAQGEHSLDDPSARWPCATCNNDLTVETLDWGRAGGSARCFVIVTNVFPSEAVPGSELLAALSAATNLRWDYFYAEVED